MTHRKIEMNNPPDTKDSKLGYRHPPVESQFRKGQSGNPRGKASAIWRPYCSKFSVRL